MNLNGVPHPKGEAWGKKIGGGKKRGGLLGLFGCLFVLALPALLIVANVLLAASQTAG